jgi:hypothetical protein
MVSLKSHPNKATTGIDLVDHRSTLYYSKYQYRARISLSGLNRTYFAKNFLDYLKVIERLKKGRHGTKMQQELDSIDLDSIERFITWRNTNTDSKNKLAMIRVEGNTAGVFSNDLQLLKTLEKIGPGIAIIDYTEIDQTIPHGTKYYVKEPKYKYRVYLKSKRIDENWKESMRRFIDRYKGTDTVIVPSNSFRLWLSPDGRHRNAWYWNNHYCSSHYFIDFNEESTDTLFALMFGDMISKRFKLEKRPDPV